MSVKKKPIPPRRRRGQPEIDVGAYSHVCLPLLGGPQLRIRMDTNGYYQVILVGSESGRAWDQVGTDLLGLLKEFEDWWTGN